MNAAAERSLSKDDQMQNGTIKWFDAAKGFGFIIQGEGGSDLYVNAKAMKKANIDAVEPGTAVSFNIREEGGKAFAEDVAVLEEQPAAALVSDRLTGILPKPKSFSDTEDEFEREWGLRRA